MSTAAPRPVKEPRLAIRGVILAAARPLLAEDPGTSLERIAEAAGVSRASFYRHFHNRAELLDALDVEPDPGARERILQAALRLMSATGLRGLQMDELAEAAGVSRASVYRLFSGREALFMALVQQYGPFAELDSVIHANMDQPPEQALPEILRAGARIAGPRIPILRSILLEISAGTPEAVEAARMAARPFIESLTHYLAAQAAKGAIRPIHPLLAAQSVVGQLVFHLLTAGFAPVVTGVTIDPDVAAQTFAQVALHGLLPNPANPASSVNATNPNPEA